MIGLRTSSRNETEPLTLGETRMSILLFKRIFLSTLILFSTSELFAANHKMLSLKIKNGGTMPISGGALYASAADAPLSQIGSKATDGLTALCQTGSNDLRFQELSSEHTKKSGVRFVVKTQGPILPGQEIEVLVPAYQVRGRSLHFEAMYGRTKDACASISISKLQVAQGLYRYAVQGQDQVISTGRFSNPVVDENAASQCQDADNAVSCLRNLSVNEDGVIRFFPGYLPSVLNFLETNYGASDVQGLLIPGAGALRFELKAK